MNKEDNTYIFKANKITFVFLKSCILILLINFNNAYSLNTDSSEPLEISADSVMMDEGEGFSTFTGDAIVTQGSLLLRADLIEMYSDNKKVNKVIAKGSIDKRAYYKQNQPNQQRFVEATAVTITYLIDKEFIYLNGNANLIQGFDSFSAGTLEYDIQNDRVLAEKSKPEEGSDEPVQRVKFKINF